MKSFKSYQNEQQELEEGVLRNLSAAVLLKRIHARSSEVHNSSDIQKQLRAIASQNTHLAAMVFAMTQFLPNNRKGTRR